MTHTDISNAFLADLAELLRKHGVESVWVAGYDVEDICVEMVDDTVKLGPEVTPDTIDRMIQP